MLATAAAAAAAGLILELTWLFVGVCVVGVVVVVVVAVVVLFCARYELGATNVGDKSASVVLLENCCSLVRAALLDMLVAPQLERRLLLSLLRCYKCVRSKQLSCIYTHAHTHTTHQNSPELDSQATAVGTEYF